MKTNKMVQANYSRAYAIVGAASKVLKESWPIATLDADLERAVRSGVSPEESIRRLCDILTTVRSEYPQVRFFWKDETLTWIGGCENFASDAGFEEPDDLVGMRDDDAEIPWARHAAKYQRDDREVIHTEQPRFNILERQTQVNGLVWRKTSKAPALDDDRVVGVFGGYEVISEANAVMLDREKRGVTISSSEGEPVG